VNEEWLSAHLDGELSADQRRDLESALAADPGLVETLSELARVRSALRGSRVEIPDGALESVIAAVENDATDGPGAAAAAPVISLADRRRVPTFAAAAAAMVIIASVVGGLGGSTTVPALGDLIAQHEVAAAGFGGVAMPDEMEHMTPMPMEAASAAALAMPADYSMQGAFVDERAIHLVYRSGDGQPVSVFRQDGDVDMERLGEGSMVSGDEAVMWTAPVNGNHVAVVDGTGYVWIVVSATAHDDMMDDLMHDLPTRSASLGERLRDAADAVIEPFRVWD
jgi:anti-sigma factor RsiW